MVFLLGATTVASAARLQNDSFETRDFTSLQISGEGWRVSAYPKDPRRGAYGAVNDVTTNGSTEFRVVHQEIKALPGKTYRASVWLRTVCISGSESFLEVQFLSKGGSVLKQFQSAHVTKNQAFTLMVIDPMASPENTERVSIRGVVHLTGQPVPSTNFHVFDCFDFRPSVAPDTPPQK